MKSQVARMESRVVLLDNGSLNPESVLAGRKLAEALSKRIEEPVDLVSVAHSDQIPADALGGLPAKTWSDYLADSERAGMQDIRVVPLFFGPSFALQKAKRAAMAISGPVVRWGECIVPEGAEDSLLYEILSASVIEKLDTFDSEEKAPIVLLVDHGSPFPEVAACRDRAARGLGTALGGRIRGVVPCSMERREGERYDFNEPTLANALNQAADDGVTAVILSHLFLFPGRHAGPGGDIDQICANSEWRLGKRLLKTGLLGLNARFPELLHRRLQALG